MKGKITLKLLEAMEMIKDFADHNMMLFDVFLKAGYGASFFKLEREFQKAQKIKSEEDLLRKCKKRYSNLICKLKSDGLIEEKFRDNKKIIVLTKKGGEKLKILKDKFSDRLPETSCYKKEDNDRFIIVIFDIPEKDRRKRDWLRSALKRIGLDLIQKSVWIGKAKVPKELMDDLLELRIINYVEIFEISKTGSLRSLI